MKPPPLPEPALPGEELVRSGLADLAAGRETDATLLLQIAAPRLGRLGIAIGVAADAKLLEHALYERLEARMGVAAHGYYNSLIRRIVSFARALEQEQSRDASSVRVVGPQDE